MSRKTKSTVFDDRPAPDGAEAYVSAEALSMVFPIDHSDQFDLSVADGGIEVAWYSDIELSTGMYRVGWLLARPKDAPARSLKLREMLKLGQTAIWVRKGDTWEVDPAYDSPVASVGAADSVNIVSGDADFVAAIRAARPSYMNFHWAGSQYFDATDLVSVTYDDGDRLRKKPRKKRK